MRSGAMFWGGSLILLGVIFLLDNLGFFGDVNIWGLLWPIFLIALGVWLIWGYFFRRSPESEHATIPLEGSARARIRVNHGAGRINISAHSDPGVLVVGDFGGGLDVKTRKDGEGLDVKMSVPTQFIPFSWYPGYSLDWNFSLYRDIPLSIELNTGASDNRIDLSELKVSEVKLSSGASSSRIILPAQAGYTRVDIEAGAAAVDLSVPAGVAARIRSRGGLSSLKLDEARFPRFGDTYQSADYDSAANKVEISVQMGAGSVSVS